MAAKFLPYLLAGISVGGQYALIAIGYTMVYGILRLINFAHGDIFTVAGFLMVYATASLPLTISIPLVVAATVLLGIAVEKIAYKPLRTAPRMSVMISAIGMSYLLQNSMWYVTGGLAKQYPALPWISDTVTVLGCQTKRVTVVTPFLVIVLVAALVTLIQKTKIGMAMRAASRDFETAQLMGIKINKQHHKAAQPEKAGSRVCAAGIRKGKVLRAVQGSQGRTAQTENRKAECCVLFPGGRTGAAGEIKECANDQPENRPGVSVPDSSSDR